MENPDSAGPSQTLPPVPVLEVIVPPGAVSAEVSLQPVAVVPSRSRPSSRSEQRALGIGALVATLAIVWVSRPVGIGLLLGTLTAFTMQPFYRSLRARWRRPALAALTSVGVTTLILMLMLGGFGTLLVGRGVGLVRIMIVALQPQGALRLRLERFTNWLGHLGLTSERLADKLGDATTVVSGRLAEFATVVAGTTFDSLLMLVFLVLSMYFVLQNWSQLTRRAEIMLPLHPRDTRALFDEFRRAGRSVLLGTLLTGLAQGILAGFGYLIFRVPQPAFFGALTAVASLIPGVGTLLVWVPAGLFLIFTGHLGLGIAELLFGAAVVVGISDYVIRPFLVGGHGQAPALVTFIALFGGIEAFGLVGLILGPVIMSLAMALLRIYEAEATLRRAAEVTELPSEGSF